MWREAVRPFRRLAAMLIDPLPELLADLAAAETVPDLEPRLELLEFSPFAPTAKGLALERDDRPGAVGRPIARRREGETEPARPNMWDEGHVGASAAKQRPRAGVQRLRDGVGLAPPFPQARAGQQGTLPQAASLQREIPVSPPQPTRQASPGRGETGRDVAAEAPVFSFRGRGEGAASKRGQSGEAAEGLVSSPLIGPEIRDSAGKGQPGSVDSPAPIDGGRDATSRVWNAGRRDKSRLYADAYMEIRPAIEMLNALAEDVLAQWDEGIVGATLRGRPGRPSVTAPTVTQNPRAGSLSRANQHPGLDASRPHGAAVPQGAAGPAHSPDSAPPPPHTGGAMQPRNLPASPGIGASEARLQAPAPPAALAGASLESLANDALSVRHAPTRNGSSGQEHDLSVRTIQEDRADWDGALQRADSTPRAPEPALHDA